jgi:hypothetical protein
MRMWMKPWMWPLLAKLYTVSLISPNLFLLSSIHTDGLHFVVRNPGVFSIRMDSLISGSNGGAANTAQHDLGKKEDELPAEGTRF